MAAWIFFSMWGLSEYPLTQNAGINLVKGAPLEDQDMDKFRKTLDVNIMGAVLVGPFVPSSLLTSPVHP